MIKKRLAVLMTSLVFTMSVGAGIANAATTSANTKTTISESDKKAIKDQLKGIKDLPTDQRKAKIQELKAKYPDFFKKRHHHKMGKLGELAKTNPQLASELKALKDLPKDQRKAKMQEIKAKYLKG